MAEARRSEEVARCEHPTVVVDNWHLVAFCLDCREDVVEPVWKGGRYTFDTRTEQVL